MNLEGGRRSRRGFYYQDLFALSRCIEGLDGAWDEVISEGGEDVVCRRHNPAAVEYDQVKTKELSPQMWSAAMLCAPELADRVETSILGRLFSGKALPDGTAFKLVTNLGVNLDLRPFVRDEDRTLTVQAVATRLNGLAPGDERSIEWCLERFSIEVRETTTDGLEAVVSRQLDYACRSIGCSLLAEEREILFALLMSKIVEAARTEPPATITPQDTREWILSCASQAQTVLNGVMQPATRALEDKLRAVGFDDQQVQAMGDARFRFTRERRAAVGRRAADLDRLSDEIAMECLHVHALRETGQVAPGMPSFVEVHDRVESLHMNGRWADADIPLALAWGSLHDQTDRCRNRYA